MDVKTTIRQRWQSTRAGGSCAISEIRTRAPAGNHRPDDAALSRRTEMAAIWGQRSVNNKGCRNGWPEGKIPMAQFPNEEPWYRDHAVPLQRDPSHGNTHSRSTICVAEK